MARHIPARFTEKLREVQEKVDEALAGAPDHFGYGLEVLPGVRVVKTEIGGRPVALSLWTLPVDIVALVGDGAYPATAALLAVDAAQARALRRAGVFVDLAQFTRSDACPGTYYALLDYLSARQVHSVLHRLLPQLEPHDERVLVA
jgi:hypothetical protein